MLRKLIKPVFFQQKGFTRNVYYNFFNQQPNNFDPKKNYYQSLNLNNSASES